ncbi:hypothetical protein D3C86_1136400 [compost metagenome]
MTSNVGGAFEGSCFQLQTVGAHDGGEFAVHAFGGNLGNGSRHFGLVYGSLRFSAIGQDVELFGDGFGFVSVLQLFSQTRLTSDFQFVVHHFGQCITGADNFRNDQFTGLDGVVAQERVQIRHGVSSIQL